MHKIKLFLYIYAHNQQLMQNKLSILPEYRFLVLTFTIKESIVFVEISKYTYYLL